MRRLIPIALMLSGCIQSTATADDPEGEMLPDAAPDAAVDQALPDGTFAPEDPTPSPIVPDCDAVPSCPPGYDQVEICSENAICDPVTECGQTILCEVCPPGGGLVCPEGMYEVAVCTNDGSCFGISDCSGSINCESCDVCPDGMIRVAACPPDTRCHQCQGDGDGLFPICAPEGAVRCPPHTVEIEGCPPDDPLCWVLDDGTACLSELCPVNVPCGGLEAQPVDACRPDALGCFERTLCGEALVCEVVSHDCDDCEPSCPEGWESVQRCAPDGRECMRIAECCNEIYCQR